MKLRKRIPAFARADDRGGLGGAAPATDCFFQPTRLPDPRPNQDGPERPAGATQGCDRRCGVNESVVATGALGYTDSQQICINRYIFI